MQATFSTQYLFQDIQLQVQLAEHHIPSPQRELQVRWLQVLNVLVDIAHQERCDIRLQHLFSALSTSSKCRKALQYHCNWLWMQFERIGICHSNFSMLWHKSSGVSAYGAGLSFNERCQKYMCCYDSSKYRFKKGLSWTSYQMYLAKYYYLVNNCTWQRGNRNSVCVDLRSRFKKVLNNLYVIPFISAVAIFSGCW